MSVIVRFAPSPTGFLHIGNARTALFNYLFAKKMGGKFLLRIEDTDYARSTDEAVDVIFEGLKWLGLHYDGEAVFQSARIDKHRLAVEKLLASGHAYKCYATSEEIERIKQDALEENRKIIYRDREEVRDMPDRDYVVRLKMPLTGEMLIRDHVQGDVTIAHSQLDDMVLLRSDGTPTYMLAVVVDDIDMNVTHIIRGDDHLINAFRQSILFQALGAKPPEFAHIPLIHAPDGTKLSKRHGAMSVRDWRNLGYPAEMMCNYLARLGWSLKDKEVFTMAEAIEAFALQDIGRSPARLDNDKISHLSGLYLRNMDAGSLIQRLMQFRKETRQPAYDDNVKAVFISVADLFKQRVSTFAELDKELAFFIEMPHADEKAKELLQDEKNIKNLEVIVEKFSALTIWDNDSVAQTLKEFLNEQNLKMPQIGPVIRAAVAGRISTPDLVPVLVALGQETVLHRIRAVF